MGSRRKRVASATVAAMAIGLGAPHVGADYWGDNDFSPLNGVGPHPDGGNVTYCWGAGFPTSLRDNAAVGMAAIDETDATTVHQGSASQCDFSGEHQVDINWKVSSFGGLPIQGEADCRRWKWTSSGVRVCDRARVRLNENALRAAAPAGISDEFAFSVGACHEAGHAVGLMHYGATPGSPQHNQADCMIGGVNHLPSNAQAAVFHRYSSHHKGHLNLWF